MNLTTTATSKMDFLRLSKNTFFCQVLTLFLFTLLSGGHLWATTYYVDATNGIDTNLGTQENWAWKTIHKVNGSTFAPGDEIFFKRGEVWYESLVIPSSGTASSPITFGAYGSGDRPLFDGTYSDFPIPVQWEHVQGNIFRTTQPSWPNNPGLLLYTGVAKPPITTLQFSSVPYTLQKGAILLQTDSHYSNLWVTSKNGNTVSGITFFTIFENENVYARQLNAGGREEQIGLLGHPNIITSLASLTEPGHWYWQDNTIYLYSANDPNVIDVKIAQLKTGINSAQHDYLIIQDITVQGYKGIGVYLTGTEGSVVQNMHVLKIGSSSHKTGILINNSKDNIIKNNRVESTLRIGIAIFSMNAQPFSHGNRVTDNTILNSGSAGISLSSGGQLIANTVENNAIIGNSVSNANTLSYDAAGIYTLFVGGGNTIKSNTILNCGSNELRSSGIMIEGGTDSSIKPVAIDGNTIENNSLAGIAVSGKNHTITNNTLRNNGVPSWENAQVVFFPSFGENASSCTVKNNIMEAGRNQTLVSVLDAWGHISPHHTIDNNTYCSTNITPFCWSYSTCSQPVNFSSWKIMSGHDSHSSFTNGICSPNPPPPTGGEGSINAVYLLLLK